MQNKFTTVLIVWLCFWILYKFYLYPRFFSPLRTFPGPPIGHPIYGQFREILEGEAGIPQRAWVKKYGPIVRVVGPIGIERLIVMKLEAIQKILVSDWADYPKPKFLRDAIGSVTGYGLLTVISNEHKQMRKPISLGFSISNVAAQSDLSYGPIEALVGILRTKIDNEKEPGNGKVFLMYEWMSKVTLDILCQAAFRYQLDSVQNSDNELAGAYEALASLDSGMTFVQRPNLAQFFATLSVPGMTEFLASEWAYNHRHWLDKFELTRICLLASAYCIRKISAQILRDKQEDSASDLESKRDVLSLILRAGKADSELDSTAEKILMSGKSMVDQVSTFLSAGHKTTSAGLAWTLWLLAKDSKSQQKLRKEVTAVFSKNARPDYRALKELTWLDCVVCESLRLMPPVPMTYRQAEKTDFIDGILVPKGTLFYIPIRVINTCKEIWGDDAEEFNPSRWLNLPLKYNSAFSSLSFMVGARSCIGKTMAVMEMKALLGALITNFEFEPAYAGQIAQPTTAITMTPKDNLPLRVRRVNL
ncbi:hypothetical protein GALMADRAFT_91777 [Galerina marginata CBS 339.88]|uniref:Cytochrome P450 n=1 Tax=Galerina marginata (strain CBS 339.88) TaxID=685588 RepID=A0A067TD57_GALM3|nr:hypothetical protein GALMADRAFT_91777 [Galerina marginata CBS 339.88]